MNEASRPVNSDSSIYCIGHSRPTKESLFPTPPVHMDNGVHNVQFMAFREVFPFIHDSLIAVPATNKPLFRLLDSPAGSFFMNQLAQAPIAGMAI